MAPTSTSLRRAALAGISYPATAGQILQSVRAYFDLEKSPPWPEEADADPTSLTPDSDLLGIVAPHIDLRVSPTAYAHAFLPLLKEPPAATYLVLGVGHQSRHEWCADTRAWSTPLGESPVDVGLAHELAAAVGTNILSDDRAFEQEHSIEFPLILLQALSRLRGCEPAFTLAPLLCGGLYPILYEFESAKTEAEHLETLAQTLRKWWDRQEGTARLILSIDGCHQGPRFDHPYKMDAARLRQTAAWENFLWRYVERRDLEGLLHYLNQDGNARYFDGVGALALLMSMFPEKLEVSRTHYEQWLEPSDASVVTFTSGTLRLRQALPCSQKGTERD